MVWEETISKRYCIPFTQREDRFPFTKSVQLEARYTSVMNTFISIPHTQEFDSMAEMFLPILAFYDHYMEIMVNQTCLDNL